MGSNAASDRSQLSVMQVEGLGNSSYGVVRPNASGGVAGLDDEPVFEEAPLQACLDRALCPDRRYPRHSPKPAASAGGEIQVANAINAQAMAGAV